MEKKIYLCELCNYKTNKLFNFKRHQNAIHEQKIIILKMNKKILLRDKKILYMNKKILYMNKKIL